MTTPLHPMQPIVLDEQGTPRFVGNPIVRYLVDEGSIDLNSIARKEFSNADQQHFAQLISYSIGGYGELSYVGDASYQQAEVIADFLLGREKCPECQETRVHGSACSQQQQCRPDPVDIAPGELEAILDGLMAAELVVAKREAERNETRWREAAGRAQTECTRRQWLESALVIFVREATMTTTSYKSEEIRDRLQAILAGPPSKEGAPR